MNARQAVVQAQAWSIQWRRAVIRQRAAYRQAVPADDGSGGGGVALHRPLNFADAAYPFLELFLAMAVSIGHILGRFPQIVELAELVRHAGQGAGNRAANGLLTVRDHAGEWPAQRLLNLREQRRQVVRRRRQQAAGEQDGAGPTLTDHPQHLMPHVGLEAVDRQDEVGLLLERCAEPRHILELKGHQFVVAGEQVGNGALADRELALAERGMQFGDGAVITVAPNAELGNEIKAKLMAGQGERAFRLGPAAAPILRAGGGVTGADRHMQAGDAGQGDERALDGFLLPERAAAGGAVGLHAIQRDGLGGGRGPRRFAHSDPRQSVTDPVSGILRPASTGVCYIRKKSYLLARVVHIFPAEEQYLLYEHLLSLTDTLDPHIQERVYEIFLPHISKSIIQKVIPRIQLFSETRIRINLLLGILPHLNRFEKKDVLRGLLTMMAQSDHIFWERDPKWHQVVQQLTHLEHCELFDMWKHILPIIAKRGRRYLLADLRELCPVLQRLGGNNALEETAMAIIEVCNRWT